MNQMLLREFHQSLGARFGELNGAEVVTDYGDWLVEHAALRQTAGVLDVSFRSRICLVGSDRVRFLHGQVSNDVKKLHVGEGCYAAITTAKGKMESDLNVFCLADELLLDFEPGFAEKISQRLEKYVVADDVQIVDAAPHYGLLSVQGPKAESVVRAIGLFAEVPTKPLASVKISNPMLGEMYLARHARLEIRRSRGNETQSKFGNESEPPHVGCYTGFDLFAPNHSLGAVADKLVAAAKETGGCATGWRAFETTRIEAGIPRFGADMDETNLPLECGPALRDVVSYNKGCYIGQEVINRVHSIGHVSKELCGLRLADDLKALPVRSDKLFRDGKEVGCITSAVKSPLFGNIALGYVRREVNQMGVELRLRTASSESAAKIADLPLQETSF